MIISKEERAELRNFCQMALGRGCPLPNRDIREFPKLTFKALDALEAAEARAEAAERERDALAETLADKCYDLYPDDCEYQWWNKNPWLEWARQQARGETKNA